MEHPSWPREGMIEADGEFEASTTTLKDEFGERYNRIEGSVLGYQCLSTGARCSIEPSAGAAEPSEGRVVTWKAGASHSHVGPLGHLASVPVLGASNRTSGCLGAEVATGRYYPCLPHRPIWSSALPTLRVRKDRSCPRRDVTTAAGFGAQANGRKPIFTSAYGRSSVIPLARCKLSVNPSLPTVLPSDDQRQREPPKGATP